ncbi:magnesium chelatase subunit D [Aestuariicoccus sp. MJ-SS9]|uniref:magnesium chelatase subunit D n=1 Tax=Aestuariicoccus sp. MJ-SS9 TaxID=3079855 RepID=UPI00290863FA|nr:magnesium chelatase subunit D [Aestuariicoccus sp. MJ-SS9]MDU8910926.1 magnesium chelatase subunit D [Aestuariicoccus sp. MJ-SS9]
MIDDPSEAWITGQLALTLLAVDPGGLGGLHLRSRAGPVRDAFLADLPDPLRRARRIAPTITDIQLFGGIDIAATLAASRVVTSRGLLADPAPLILTMAERCPANLAARLAQTLDAGRGHALILLDEGAEPDERAPDTLTERLAFSLCLDGLRATDLADIALDATDIEDARRRLSSIAIPDAAMTGLVIAAVRFGIDSLRAPLLALRAARAHAALAGRDTIGEDDLQIAAQLVYAHRATCLPQDADDRPEDQPEPDDTPQDKSSDDSALDLPPDMLIDAVKALLPPEILHALSRPVTGTKGKGSGGAGQKRRGNRRGRPLPSRPGKPDGSNRIDIIATLRAAAPWQPLRRKAQPDASGLLIRPSDIHIRRFQDLSDRLIIFAVDASGSAAMARLAEAKGAVELMLAEAYARRDHVALIAFRGEDAQIVLPPTRSLVQTKRQLAGLPGGGGTPLAAGLKATAELARQALGQGLSPAVALMTDGRANVPLPGRTGRAAAAEDAQAMARVLRGMNLPGAVVDTSVRPQRDLRHLAGLLGADYVPLPRADAHGLSRAITGALGG